ncbi:putative transmembrane ascorbate ferrireductase 3 [Morus notabilis]|uniref:ascorbate ferrireductase (transmembrane) n=1 Tax=Morus notabilis TaxID=981085 RepID=W9RRJ4_9ROSA|nr:probable ascorbate-specific transmembrane electron transporter 1 [Morus notabilis]EXC05046.1 putative transmembrane ascorbate ferrireductase 3 [Morus notabilis]
MAPSGRSYQISATPAAILAHLIAIAVTTLVLVWLLHFQDGFAFKSLNKLKIFNLHPFLMIVGLIIMGGEAMMAYKTVPGTRRAQKGVHVILHQLALLAGVLGTYVIFKFKHEDGTTKDFVTLHTWLGIITISAYGLQFLLSFFTFLFPEAAAPRKATILPWHVFFGMAIFLLAIGTAETGLVQKSIALKLNLKISQEGLIVNFIGLLISLFGVSVGLSVILPRRGYY